MSRRSSPREEQPGTSADRRRTRWREFRRAYPGVVTAMGIAFAVMVAVNGWLLVKGWSYAQETERLRAGMTEAERLRADFALKSTRDRIRVMIELIRRQSRIDRELHLTVSIDSGRMHLEQQGARLRDMAIQVGAGRNIGNVPDTVLLAPPRGARTVQRVITERGSWEVPQWVYTDRALGIPEVRTVAGALGPAALVLSGGTVIYSLPKQGPLADSTYVLPGSVRASAEDLRAIVKNVKPGMRVYFY